MCHSSHNSRMDSLGLVNFSMYYYNYSNGLEKEQQEYNSKIINGYKIIDSVYAKAEGLSDNINTIHTNLENISHNFEEIENYLVNFIISLESKWFAYKHLLSSKIQLRYMVRNVH